MAEISVNGIGALRVTMFLDSTTKTTIGTDYDSAINKAVALKGNNTVGYGTTGDALYGIIKKVEPDGVATVQVKGFVEGVPAITASSGTTLGSFLAVNGAGKVKNAAEGTVTKGIATAVDTTNAVVDIELL